MFKKKDDEITRKVNKVPFLYSSSPVFCCVAVHLGDDREVGAGGMENPILFIQFHLTMAKSANFDPETPQLILHRLPKGSCSS